MAVIEYTQPELDLIADCEQYHGKKLDGQGMALAVAQGYWIGELDQDQSQSFLDRLHL